MGFWENIAAVGKTAGRSLPASGPVAGLAASFRQAASVVKTGKDYADAAVQAFRNPFRFLQGYLGSAVGAALRRMSAVGGAPSLVDYVQEVFAADGVLKNFYTLLFRDFNPDINGYTLAFLVPPDFSGLPRAVLDSTVNLVPFAAMDYSPPGVQLSTGSLHPRSGSLPYAVELTETSQFSISYIDDIDLDIFGFHCAWLYYIFELLNGVISPSQEYIDGTLSGHLDYAGALYVVKYMPDMQTITYVGKCTGVFPQSLPVRDVLGTRMSNELTTVHFTYMSAAYRDHVVNDSSSTNAYLLEELQQLVLSRFLPFVF